MAACADDNFEDNDAADAAARVQQDEYPGLQICDSDDDWYTIEVCSGGNLAIALRFTHADGDIDVTLRSLDDARLAGGVSSSDDERVAWVNNSDDAVTVRWRVYGFNGAENDYDMTVNIEGCGPAEGDVRLADGDVASSGRVEIFAGGRWGTVCDDFWALNAAEVVCRQLGYQGAIEAVQQFGGGADLPIVLDDVQCTGQEANLLECRHLAINENNCVSAENAGVVCIDRILPID